MYVTHLQSYLVFASTAVKKVIPREEVASGDKRKTPLGEGEWVGRRFTLHVELALKVTDPTYNFSGLRQSCEY